MATAMGTPTPNFLVLLASGEVRPCASYWEARAEMKRLIVSGETLVHLTDVEGNELDAAYVGVNGRRVRFGSDYDGRAVR